MTPSKDELLRGLAYVQGMLGKMQTILSNYIAQERNFRKVKKEIDPKAAIKKDIKKISSVSALVVLALLALISPQEGTFTVLLMIAGFWAVAVVCKKIAATGFKALGTDIGFFTLMAMNKGTRGDIGVVAFWCFIISYICKFLVYILVLLAVFGTGTTGILALAVVIAVDVGLIVMKNQKIAAANQDATVNNEQVRAKRKQLHDQYLALQRELQNNAPSWFPPDYYNIEAVNFFIHAIRNGRADSVKEMVNLFESTNQHKEMVAYQKQQTQQLNQLVAGQQAIQGQLRFANMMNVLNFIKLDNIEAAIY